METGDVYPFADDRAFYDDDRSVCMLELYPRNLGHTIVLVKPHYEDLSRVPRDIAQDVFGLVHSTVGALKYSTGAEKVYVNTMCDGRRNHLHFQLVPRLPGDEIRGSRLFVKERSMLTDYSEDIALLRTAMMEAERR